MQPEAPRLPWHLWSRFARGAFSVLCSCLALTAPLASFAQEIVSARFIGPTQAYRHGVLGDTVEYSGMRAVLSDGAPFLVGFSEGGRIFEDITPRLWDVTGDGAPEIVVIETDPPQGAQLAIYGVLGGDLAKIAATPHIGQTNRWLAPIAAADLDGDGHIEIAYIDRPHLARTLRIWRYREGALTEVASAPGLTNHRIGWNFIAGGLRSCDGPPELITADGRWRRIVATRFDGTELHRRDIARYTGPDSLTAATSCD